MRIQGEAPSIARSAGWPRGLARWLNRSFMALPGLTVIPVAWIVVPGAAAPFSAPKAAALALAGAALLVLFLLGARGSAAPVAAAPLEGGSAGRRAGLLAAPLHRAAVWGGAAALVASAWSGDAAEPGVLLLHTGAAALLLATVLGSIDVPRAAWAIAVAGAGVSLVAGLQAAGHDPFAALGLSPRLTGARMSVYGTLGNPDFVAAFCLAAMCVALGEALVSTRPRRERWLFAAAALLHLPALVAARSFGTLLALFAAAALALLAAARAGRSTAFEALPSAVRRRRARAVAAAAVGAAVLAGALLGAACGRDLSRTIEGRIYLWRVAAPHALEAPLLGRGPGSIAALWPGWEAGHFAAGAPEADRAFADVQDHLHCDYLETLLERGAAGLLALALVLTSALWAGWRARSVRGAALACALASLGARALVDFPLARPAELTLFVLLVSMSFSLPPPLERKDP